MKTALLEIKEKYRPDRIIIECSGSAFPATLAFQIRELERETEYDLRLDAIVTVIDAENFTGYEDTSPTAKMQASYTDVILINKWEHISDRALDILIDHLNTLNDLTPKVRCEGRAGVDPNLIFGLDSKLFLVEAEHPHANHHDEVETPPHSAGHNHEHGHGDRVVDAVNGETLSSALSGLSKETIWRVKGFVRTAEGIRILNWAFGRFDLSPTSADGLGDRGSVLLTVMGERGEVKRAARKFAEKLGASIA
ncbi:CobW/HypB/UreG, nucleotide-binding domain-containing protein [Fomitopsis serialis]|uniref:CobW/HypB/UreG, nucleotide-binding domain-containing protein n=1 Tax=Fomitopsis serialis TaxID=139415 RepID=UPI00200741C7|nr:CobW/HypB/UreG, nucleotide-binding domain-containing protein [Neoantrodia serialis]KAH9930156.1 CobW/HypB/UreG, nucleotide-binding domain-containing protein [Neoantrodia serialis]